MLASAGYRVTGVDISRECLAFAQQAADQANVNVEWRQANLYDQPNLPACDGVLWFGNGFAYADAQHTEELFGVLSQVVRKGGRMIIDSGAIAESILPNFTPDGDYEFHGIRMRARRQYLPLPGCMEIEYTFSKDELSETRFCRQWVFKLSQVRDALRNAGWRLTDVFSNCEKAPYRLGDHCAYMVAVNESR